MRSPLHAPRSSRDQDVTPASAEIHICQSSNATPASAGTASTMRGQALACISWHCKSDLLRRTDRGGSGYARWTRRLHGIGLRVTWDADVSTRRLHGHPHGGLHGAHRDTRAISNQQPAIENQPSAISHQPSAISHQPSAIIPNLIAGFDCRRTHANVYTPHPSAHLLLFFGCERRVAPRKHDGAGVQGRELPQLIHIVTKLQWEG